MDGDKGVHGISEMKVLGKGVVNDLVLLLQRKALWRKNPGNVLKVKHVAKLVFRSQHSIHHVFFSCHPHDCKTRDA